MPAPLADTNILLRYFARDNEAMAAATTRLVGEITSGSETVELVPIALFEALFTLQSFYRESRERIRDLLTPVIELPGVLLPDQQIYIDALAMFASTNLSFADAFQVTYTRERGILKIYSYDRDFDRFSDVTRIEPA